jgi:2-polyprenyl-3-methyl-5-hydroxy-6-metoxy-1,4-benzoquinol methylase
VTQRRDGSTFLPPRPVSADTGLVAAVQDSLTEVFAEKYGDLARAGWGPRMRRCFRHATPDDWYEATLSHLVGPGTNWLDVGCGRDLFPNNLPTARRLAQSCHHLTGIDPDANILENMLVHERIQTDVDSFTTDRRFDLITLRMVAEHICDPAPTMAKLRSVLAPEGRLLVYTVSRWSISAIIAALTPIAVHHAVKRILWRTDERDTFETYYRMNSRATLLQLAAAAGLREEAFIRLDDCRTTTRSRPLHWLELLVWRGLNGMGLSHPETCILAVYRPAL